MFAAKFSLKELFIFSSVSSLHSAARIKQRKAMKHWNCGDRGETLNEGEEKK